MNRREFVGLAAAGAAVLSGLDTAQGKMRLEFRLPELPYPEDALEPVISKNTIGFHYGKHHAGYVAKINDLKKGTEFDMMPLEDIIRKTAGVADKSSIFNNAAQVWNHSFYWNGMKPGGGGEPTGKLAEMIKRCFSSFAQFKDQFVEAAMGRFGSGWAWLVQKGDRLEIVSTPNAETPITGTAKPLLTLDVWEHAYYLDYQNRRKDYAVAWLEKLANWDFAVKNLG